MSARFRSLRASSLRPSACAAAAERTQSADSSSLEEEAGVELDYLEQLCTVGSVERDPRGRVITVADLQPPKR